MENLVTEFQETLKKLGVKKNNRLLIAVSGGLDSVVLAACCDLAALDFGIAHANFQLRGEESERDENFVRQLARKYERPFFIKKFETEKQAAAEKCSIQVAARNLRYEWFNSLLGNDVNTFQFILTAHHLDDNLETMLMHFFRGTGIAGLVGMPVKNQRLIRPLLSFSKKQLRSFAESTQLSWVEDSTNAVSDYTRNYFRNVLIPSAESVFPGLLHNLENNLQRFSETQELFDQAVLLHKKKLLKQDGNEIHIPVGLLRKSIPTKTILYEILKAYAFTPSQMDEVIRLMDSSNGKYVSSNSHRIIKNRNWLIIAPLEKTGRSHFIIVETDKQIPFPGGLLSLKFLNSNESPFIPSESVSACLNAEKILFPLILRKWKPGDYFYPLGMKKKKKLARFFIDQKLSRTAKEKVWVLVTDSRIIWVVGHRIDDRFCVGPSVHKTLLINYMEEPSL